MPTRREEHRNALVFCRLCNSFNTALSSEKREDYSEIPQNKGKWKGNEKYRERNDKYGTRLQYCEYISGNLETYRYKRIFFYDRDYLLVKLENRGL